LGEKDLRSGGASTVPKYGFSRQPNGAWAFSDSTLIEGWVKGTLRWDASIRVTVPLRIKSVRTTDVMAVGKSFSVPGGSLTVAKVGNRFGNTEVEFSAQGEVTPFLTGERKDTFSRFRSEGSAWNAKDTGVPPHQEGLFFLNEKDEIQPTLSYGHQGSAGNIKVNLSFHKKPKDVVVQWFEQKIEKKIEMKLDGIPVP